MVRPVFLLILLLSLTNARAQTAAASPSPAPVSTGSPQAPTVSGTSNTVRAAAPVAAGVTFSRINVDGPYIAMTFDDGPSGPNTPRLLDLAAKKHIKLTFFLIGECAQHYPELVQRELAEGHQVGNHSWTHPDLAKMSDDAVRAELQKTQDVIVNTTGYRPVLMRPPYGALTARQRLWVAHEFGFKIILWDVDPLDWRRPGSDVVAHRIIAGARPGSIILSHDIHSATVDAMPQVFDTLLAKGFKFVTVSELIAMDKGATSKEKKPAAAATPVPVAQAAIPASTQ
jgi:peptidoglycan/xylan/chitin deacetylase (PgdA/CDA1 family)